LGGTIKIEIERCISLFLLIGIEIIIVILSNRSNIGKLIVFYGSVLFYIFPFIFRVSYKIKNYYIFFFLLIASIIYGIVQHSIGYFIWDLNWGMFSPSAMDITALGNWGTFTRAFSFFSGVQDFALFIIFTTLLLWINLKGNGIKLLVATFLIIGLYIAGAKAMILSFAVALLAHFVRKKINASLLFFGLYVLPYICIMALYIMLNNMLVAKLSMMTGLFNFGTVLPRLEIIYRYLSEFNFSNSIFGVGMGVTGTFDNMYIRILAETGIIGLVVFLFFLHATIKKLYYIQERSSRLSSKENYFLFIVLIVMTFSMHSGELLMSRFSMIVFVYIVICINTKYKKIKEYESKFSNIDHEIYG
jgi:hypothetical protein